MNAKIDAVDVIKGVLLSFFAMAVVALVACSIAMVISIWGWVIANGFVEPSAAWQLATLPWAIGFLVSFAAVFGSMAAAD